MAHLNKKLCFLLVVAALMLASGSAFARDSGSVATMKDPTYSMSLSFSPLHLFVPVVEITGEFKANDRWSVAVIGGGGSVSADPKRDGEEGEGSIGYWEVGGQARYFALGDFNHGLMVGAEVLYSSASTDHKDVFASVVSTNAEGLAIAPFVGYKIATELGLTFDAQAGVARTGIGVTKEGADGEGADDETGGWEPLINLNVGWSF